MNTSDRIGRHLGLLPEDSFTGTQTLARPRDVCGVAGLVLSYTDHVPDDDDDDETEDGDDDHHHLDHHETDDDDNIFGLSYFFISFFFLIAHFIVFSSEHFCSAQILIAVINISLFGQFSDSC